MGDKTGARRGSSARLHRSHPRHFACLATLAHDPSPGGPPVQDGVFGTVPTDVHTVHTPMTKGDE
jgi:hypothetical protein